MPKAPQKERALEMHKLYLQGYSLEEVGKAYSITRQSVYSMFVRHNLPMREKRPLPYIEFNGGRYTIDRDGYYRRTGGSRNFLHQDVWLFFNGDITAGLHIHHKDGDKSNNKISNLECIDPVTHGKIHKPLHGVANPPACVYCGKMIERKSNSDGSLESPAALQRRMYCNTACHALHKKGKPRGWSAKSNET